MWVEVPCDLASEQTIWKRRQKKRNLPFPRKYPPPSWCIDITTWRYNLGMIEGSVIQSGWKAMYTSIHRDKHIGTWRDLIPVNQFHNYVLSIGFLILELGILTPLELSETALTTKSEFFVPIEGKFTLKKFRHPLFSYSSFSRFLTIWGKNGSHIMQPPKGICGQQLGLIH